MSGDPLNEEKLVPYLADNIEGFSHLRNVKKFSIGQSNPTFLLETDTASYVIGYKRLCMIHRYPSQKWFIIAMTNQFWV